MSKGKQAKLSKVWCYEDHKPLKIGDYEIDGGSCHFAPKGKDIYIALDRGAQILQAQFPWTKATQVLFPITDRSVPNVEDTKSLIKYLKSNLAHGRKIHVGCIGGHGRTGLILAILYKELTGEADAVTKVRELYCKKAVESQEQVDWLFKNFGIKKVKMSKPFQPSGMIGYGGDYYGTGTTYSAKSKEDGWNKYFNDVKDKDKDSGGMPTGTIYFDPIKSDNSLF